MDWIDLLVFESHNDEAIDSLYIISEISVTVCLCDCAESEW